MSRPIWFVNIVKHFFMDRFTIARWTKKSRFMRKSIDFLLFEDDEIYYLPKDSVVKDNTWLNSARIKHSHAKLDETSATVVSASSGAAGTDGGSAREVIAVGESIEKPLDVVLPSDAVRHFIEQAEYRWVMNKCICRDAAHCKDYPIDIGCIFLGEAVQKINPLLGRMVSKQEALGHLDRSIELGLIQMIGRNKLDTQWMGVQPGHKLLTICNCCECCCLYKVLPDLDISISSKITRMPGVTVQANPEICVGCGECTQSVCVTDNIRLVNEKALIGDFCLGCGRCVETCPNGAIDLLISDENFINTTIARLAEKVDVT